MGSTLVIRPRPSGHRLAELSQRKRIHRPFQLRVDWKLVSPDRIRCQTRDREMVATSPTQDEAQCRPNTEEWIHRRPKPRNLGRSFGRTCSFKLAFHVESIKRARNLFDQFIRSQAEKTTSIGWTVCLAAFCATASCTCSPIDRDESLLNQTFWPNRALRRTRPAADYRL